MVLGGSSGGMARFLKVSGRRGRRMGTGYGDRRGEITMKVAGKIIIRTEKVVLIAQASLSIEATFSNPSRMAMAKRNSPTEINIRGNTVKVNPTDTVGIFGRMGTTMREISLMELGRGEAA